MRAGADFSMRSVMHEVARADRRALLWIGSLIAFGVAVRISTLRATGFAQDVAVWMAWAERLAAIGPARFYEPGYFTGGYPPGFPSVLWGLGVLLDGEALRLATKAVSIPADVAITVIVARLLWRRVGRGAAVLGAALWSLSPAAIIAGPYWGQIDAVGSLAFLGALLAAGAKRWALAGALAGLAVMTKPQFGLTAVVLGAAALFELIQRRDWRPGLRASLAGLAVITALSLPYRLWLPGLVGLVRDASDVYPYTSLYAFNLWSIVTDFWTPDEPYFLIGAVLLAAGIGAACVPLWWRRDTAMLLAAAALAAAAFYLLPTRAHERYIFPSFVLLLPLAAARSRVLVPYLVLAAAFALTLYFALTRYPDQNGVTSPQWLELTLFSRTGQIALALVMCVGFALLAWRLIRGEARLEPTFDAKTAFAAAEAPARPRWTLPPAFAIGSPATRRDIILALIVALAVLGTRGFRLDWPRDMYFDEVYHARTAFELLAQRDPYEWTHPHLAKEVMALGVLAFSDDRVVGTEAAPVNVTAFTVANDGTRVYGLSDGTIELRDRDGRDPRILHVLRAPPIALAVDGEHLYAVTTDEVGDLPFDPAARSAHREKPLPGLAFRPLPRAGAVTAFSVVRGRVVVGTATWVAAFPSVAEDPIVADVPAIGFASKLDGSELYVLDPEGSVHVLDPATLKESKTYPSVAKERAIAFAQGPGAIVLARMDEPVLDSIDVNDGHKDTVTLANARTGTFASGVTAMAVVPRTDFLYAVADGRVVVVDVHGLSPFATIPSTGTRLGIDGTGDTLVALGAGGAERIDTGRLALSWRLPGVIAGALLAFVVVLLASRLFRSRVIPALVGIAIVLDGSMFAQARIGMNDVYVALFIVAGWYFIVAAHKPRLSSRGDLLIAGVLLGLGAASKWAAFYTLAGVLVASLAVTIYAYQAGRAGKGGPLDLFARKGLNAAFLFVAFAIIPVGIYLASYLHWFGGNTAPYGWNLWELTQQMYWYHSGLTSPHPAASPWWSWPLVLKPVYWYFGQSDGGNNAYIYDAGNIVLFWAAIPASVWCAVAAIRARSVLLGFVVFAMLAQYVAWIPISRVLFFYHFFTALPFYLLALACGLAYLWETGRSRRVVVYIAAAAAAFVYFYPFVSALPVPGSQAAMFFILPTWQYDCQFYPSFVCPVNAPGDIPFVAILARLGMGLALAAIAAVAFFVLRSPDRALAAARSVLGRGAGRRNRAR